MTEKLLKLYRLKSETAGYGETRSAVVYALSPKDAIAVLAEAFDEPPDGEVGYLERGAYAHPYKVVEEIPFQRGLVLAEGQDG